MTLAQAVILYDLILAAVFATDFLVISRHNESVVAKVPLFAMFAVAVGMTAVMPAGRVQFFALAIIVLGAASFGYSNFLAFVKRGVTFSILSNHTRPEGDRIPDHQFIAIDDRLIEMHGHGWAEEVNGQWQLTGAGHRVARVRQLLLRILNIEAVG